MDGEVLPPRPLGGLFRPRPGGLGKARLRGLAFAGGYRYAAPEGYLGEVAGEGRLSTPYGEVRLSGRGLGLDLEGEGLPLVGRLDLHPFRLAYRYAGALPLGLGELNAEGVYPGAWLSGTYRYGEAVLALEGLPGFRVGLSGGGVRGRWGRKGWPWSWRGSATGPLPSSGG